MKIIIIPDIHQNIQFMDYIVSKHEGHKFVFLGDYFDTHDPQKYKSNDFCYYFRDFIEKQTNSIFLMGNHDLHYYEALSLMGGRKYFAGSLKYKCSGFSKNRVKTIKKIIGVDFFKSLRLYHQENDFTMSHAGFSPYHFKPMLNVEENLMTWKEEMDKLHDYIRTPFYSPLDHSSIKRGGKSKIGSPIWMDFLDEFEPIEGLNQVVGHTGKRKSLNEMNNGQNYCIDNSQKTYAILEDKKILLFKINDTYDEEYLMLEDVLEASSEI